MQRKGWAIFLGVGCAAVVAGGLFAGPARPIVPLIIGWASIAATLRGAHHWNPNQRGPWHAIAAGGALFLVAAIVIGAQSAAEGVGEVFPSIGDPLIYLGYIAIIIGERWLIQLRGGRGAGDNMLDALIVAAGVSVLAWATLLAPYIRLDTVPMLDRTVTVGYSMLDVILLAMTARLAVGPGARTPSYYMLAGAIGIVFVTDLIATMETIGQFNGDLRFLMPFAYVLVASAALHPSMAKLTERSETVDPPLTWRRVAMLGLALLMAPAVLIWQINEGDPVDLPVVVTGSIVLSLLVLARLTSLVRTKERTAARERVLREASATLVGATSQDEMRSGALDAVLRLGRGADLLRVALASIDDGTMRITAARGHNATMAGGFEVRCDDLPEAVRNGLASLTTTTLANTLPVDLSPGNVIGQRAVVVAPLITKATLRGALIVTSAEPLAPPVCRSIESLVSELSLGLESLALAAEVERQKSAKRFRVLVEHSSDIVMVVGDAGTVTFASPACRRLLGRDDTSFLGRRPFEFAHDDDRDLARHLLDRPETPVLLDGPAALAKIEVRLQHVDGTYRWFDMNCRDLRDEPEISGLVLTAREITDRKGAEQQLASSEARFRALVQSSADVVAVVDTDGRFTYISPAITGMLGYEPTELIGRLAGNLVPAEDLQTAIALGEEFHNEHIETASIEVQVRDQGGSWHTLDITITDLRHEPAVAGVVLNCRDVTVRKALEYDLRYQALHDTLTGLGNRAMFTTRVSEALERGSGGIERLVATLFVDLDDFKTVNDSLGHAVGDDLLIGVAERLKRCLRPGDVAARLGGDEFAVLVETTKDDADVVRIADRVLDALRDPFAIGDRQLTIGASVGIAIDRDRTLTAEVLLRNADMAMYLAKERGKGRHAVFEEEMHATAFERLELKTDLTRGIEHGQLRLHYQPIVSLQTGRITGVEALVRWQHPERGLLGPDSFIPMAEDTGLIVPLGQWVLEEACQQLRAWQLSLPTNATLSMSVNLSVRQLQYDGIVDDVASTLGRFGLDPSTLNLEITESMLMVDTELTRQRLADLRAVGTSLAIDDFGTGYSSLGYIQRFPLDVIKIDRSFVADLGGEPGDRFVVQSMIELAQRLGVHIVAEGIEHKHQLLALQALGCDLGQGFYFSEPVPAYAMADLLATSLTDGARFLYR